MDQDLVMVDPPSKSPLSTLTTLDSAMTQPNGITKNTTPQAPAELDNRPSSPIRLQHPDALVREQDARSPQSSICESGKLVHSDRNGPRSIQIPAKSCFHEEKTETQPPSGLSTEIHEGNLRNPSASLLLPTAATPAESFPPGPPPPPPAVPAAAPTRQRVIPKRPIFEVVESAQQLRPTETPLIERVVNLPVGAVHRRAALTHHSATKFDLKNHLWLLRYGEIGFCYARPSKKDLKRFENLESAGLTDEIPGLLTKGGTPFIPAPTNTLSIWVGEVMGVSSTQHATCFPASKGPADPHCPVDGLFCDAGSQQRANETFFTYYIVTERVRAKTSEGSGYGFGTSSLFAPPPPPPPPPPPFETIPQQFGEEKVFRIETVGSMEACLAKVYHAALSGWSTVFTCVVHGDPDLKEAKPGLGGFQRVPNLVSLLQAEEEEGKVNVFF